MRLRRAVGAVVLAGVTVVANTGPALGHALVRHSTPSDGALLQRGPPDVTITFTETPDPSLSSIRVLNQRGDVVSTGTPQPVPAAPSQLRVGLGETTKGVYTVTWRTVSKVDGHLTAGSFTFGVGVAPTAAMARAGSTTPPPAVAAVAGRWLLYWGLALLLGGATAGLFLFRGSPSRNMWLLAVGFGMAFGGLAIVFASERATVGAPLVTLLGSTTGVELLAQEVVVLCAGAAVVIESVRRNDGALWFLGAAAAGGMLIHALSGHAGSRASGMVVNVGVQWIHIAAAGLWAGGLVWLLVAMLTGQATAGSIGRFSRVAGWALAAVFVTGILRALDEVGGVGEWRRLFGTSFGITLTVKAAIFAVLVAVAAVNRYRNVSVAQRGNRRPLVRAMTAEVLLASAIFAATGILSELPPAASAAQAATRQASLSTAGADFGRTVRVHLTITPGAVGVNRFEADIADYDTGKPVHATRVELDLSLPSRPDLTTPTLPLERAGIGRWTGTGTVLSMPGRWKVSALVQRGVDSVEVPLTIAVPAPPQRVQVQRQAGAPDLYTFQLASGNTLQAYVDPGRPGINQLHLTFFRPDGKELAIREARASEGPSPSGPRRALHLKRFSRGHLVANTHLTAGPWRFSVDAVTTDGQQLSAYFVQRIEANP